jgi:hypothetical protein
MHLFGQQTSTGQGFKAGDKCPQSGIYRAHHYQHRAPHPVFVLCGEPFPLCRRCQEHISFKLLIAGKPWQEEADLAAEAVSS